MTGEELRALRLAHGLTQTQLAEALGYEWQYIGKLENGHKPIAERFARHFTLFLESLKKKSPGKRKPLDSH